MEKLQWKKMETEIGCAARGEWDSILTLFYFVRLYTIAFLICEM